MFKRSEQDYAICARALWLARVMQLGSKGVMFLYGGIAGYRNKNWL